MMGKINIFMFFSIFSLHLIVLPITVEAARESTVQVTGKLDTVEEESTVEASNEKEYLEEKETIVKEVNLPTTGEQENVVGKFIGIVMLFSAVVIYVRKRKKTT